MEIKDSKITQYWMLACFLVDSELEHVRRSRDRLQWARKVPWFQQGIWDLRDVQGDTINILHILKDKIQRIQPIHQLHLSSHQNIILRGKILISLASEINFLHQLLVQILQPGSFIDQILRKLLLLHSRSPSRFPIR